MRVVKEAEERKNEILDVAERLFISRGFDRTSTNDILEEVGIARGTLYYHFKSKEEILDALITREMKRKFEEELIGAETELLIEEKIEIDGEEWQVGHTKEYVRAVMKSSEDLSGKIVKARLTGWASDGSMTSRRI